MTRKEPKDYFEKLEDSMQDALEYLDRKIMIDNYSYADALASIKSAFGEDVYIAACEYLGEENF